MAGRSRLLHAGLREFIWREAAPRIEPLKSEEFRRCSDRPRLMGHELEASHWPAGSSNGWYAQAIEQIASPSVLGTRIPSNG